ncbi:hypothetical protein SOV_24820 [Sporomusa ovata DSM 2662]|uniref:N-acetyltransferase domain-containing protein n=1 Tax=Sporomusa ovata TaxID=2378 RepID=A0A0U1L3U4_9FIRM|nr:GNAT family N-acetyltransferase [Sporomusa ovata]EQB25795.1 putative acetyltransferase [Sporomusa ovata DSM 2662]CQR74358.1 hypothetical protein SpAn4DRAFT_0820 [Sporomusa ovata]
MDNKFFEYYDKYLGISMSNKHPKIYPCKQRNKLLARNYFQHLIITNREGLIYSIEPLFYSQFKMYIDIEKYSEINESLILLINNFFNKRFGNYKIRKMLRLTTANDLKFLQSTCARKLTIGDKDIFLNSGNKSNTKPYKERKWDAIKAMIREERAFVYVHQNQILSLAIVSNIDFNGGNIVVNTVPEYRNFGYGKLVVSKAAKWCLENDVLPIYWVDSLNVNSLKLALSIGFQIMAEELVVSTEKDEK